MSQGVGGQNAVKTATVIENIEALQTLALSFEDIFVMIDDIHNRIHDDHDGKNQGGVVELKPNAGNSVNGQLAQIVRRMSDSRDHMMKLIDVISNEIGKPSIKETPAARGAA